ncbi:MAG: Spy/CpxP family protein refolding chaperone [Betaproteobacteria bacterium]
MNRLVLNTLVATGIALAAPLAVAQSGAEGMQARQAERHMQGERAFRLPSERVEARIAYLKTALKISDAQQPQWDAFAYTLRRQAQDMDERIKARRTQGAEGRRDARPTAIERLERRQARLAAASARLNETLVAAKPLYAALSPEQQKIADEVLAPQRRGMGHGHRRGHA